ncbi:MAG: hypothetical protein JNM80_09805 [Phycisphaerae bacterium]|nr:hypothetical protein [Phycisphaerae bacterium]
MLLATGTAMGQQRQFGPLVHWGAAGAKDGLPTGYFKQVATGLLHSVGLRTDGTVAVWGGDPNSYGHLSGMPIGGGWIKVRAGYDHSVAMNQYGALYLWGNSYNGATTMPDPDRLFIDVAAGENFCVGIRADNLQLEAWGSDYCFGTGHNRPNGQFAMLDAAGHHVLLLKIDDVPDRLLGWGPLPPCPRPDPLDPCCPNSYNWNQWIVPAGVASDAWKFSAGHAHSLVVGFAGGLTAWGRNGWGEGSTTPITGCPSVCVIPPSGCNTTSCLKHPPSPFPSQVNDARGGYFHSVIQRTDGSLTGWGRNDDYQSDTPPGSFISFSSSYNHGVAISTCYANCDNSYSQPVITPADLTCWLERFNAGDPGADCDGNGVLNSNDYECYLALYNLGCNNP